jgi:2-amino-4-hydroxy-6-hydroxymethyldihydropteridine diphosphokinase
MTAVILGLGGNLGEREANIRAAVKALKAHESISKVKLSPLVESFAHTLEGIDETKPKYLNGVISLETKLTAKELLAFVQSIETERGRVRLARWGSRTLDIDIITFGDTLKATKTLTLPHPRAYERAFVLVPWMLLDPAAVLPGHGSVAKLAEPLKDQVEVIQ